MDLDEIYLEIPPEHIAYVKFIFESYEEVGIIRTVDRKKSIIVLLATDAPLLADQCRRLAQRATIGLARVEIGRAHV